MPVPALVGDLLPLGRHQVTLAEVETAFVDDARYSESRSRRMIWQHFERANEVLQASVLVHGVWIAGSFTTSKQNPRDIDVLYIVSAEDRMARSPGERRTVDTFVNRRFDDQLGRKMPEHGLFVDSYVLDWAPHITRRSESAGYRLYSEERGYWDDWWARRRTGSKKDPAKRADALPARGYLEVQFSDYA